MVLIEPLLRRVHEQAPGVRLELSPIPADMQESDRGLLQHDLLIGPLGFRFLGRSEVVFRDRFVCIVDPANPRLQDGWLSLTGLGELPHAAATFGHAGQTPPERSLAELGGHRNVQGTAAGVVIAEPPFGRVELVEAAWWHPTRTADPAQDWLRGVLAEAAQSLPPP